MNTGPHLSENIQGEQVLAVKGDFNKILFKGICGQLYVHLKRQRNYSHISQNNLMWHF